MKPARLDSAITRGLTALTLPLLLVGCGGDEAPAAVAAPPAPETTVIATGADIAGANGIHFGPDGLLYVASVIGSEIVVIDPESGAVQKRLGAAEGVIGPDDIAFAPDGSYFWTSILTGEVAGFTPDGYKVVAASLTPGVNPLTFSDDGRLFVSQCFFGDGLFEVDPKGVNPPRLISDELGPGCGLNGMDWGPDGRLYGPRWFVGEVVSFDVDTNEMRVEASGFKTPAAVKFDGAGRLHVLDTGTGEVVRIDDEGNHQVLATLDPGLDNFAFDADDRVFVSSFTDGYVKRVEADGSTTSLLPGGMAHPGGITMLGGRAVLADLHAIRFHDPVSGSETEVQRNVLGVGEMGGALNLAADGDNLLLVSWVDGDVRLWDPVKKHLVERWEGLAGPVAAVRYGGEVIVTEHGGGRVIALGAEGPRVVMEGLSAPTGLAVDAGILYLTDRADGTVLQIGEGGKLLPEARVVASGLTTPEGIVASGDALYVVEADTGAVVEIRGAERRVLGTISAGSQAASADQPPSMVFNGLTLVGPGELLATGETDRSLYRITF